MTLLEVRNKYDLSQKDASLMLNTSLRTYIRYEKDDNYGSELKRQAMIRKLNEMFEITETKGLLSVEQIKESLTKLYNEKYNGQIEFCYLFGSYAKGYATESSDIDLCVSTSLKGLKFIGLSEDIRIILHKKIDLIRFSNLENNITLIEEIMKDGIKIYG